MSNIVCPKCGYRSGDAWLQCNGSCPMPGSPHFSKEEQLRCESEAAFRQEMNRDNSSLLRTSIINNKLAISIGLSSLKWSFEHSDLAAPYDEDKNEFRQKLEVTNEIEFAKDVVAELSREDESGTTMTHRLLDKAMKMAVENGTIGVSECDKKVTDG